MPINVITSITTFLQLKSDELKEVYLLYFANKNINFSAEVFFGFLCNLEECNKLNRISFCNSVIDLEHFISILKTLAKLPNFPFVTIVDMKTPEGIPITKSDCIAIPGIPADKILDNQTPAYHPAGAWRFKLNLPLVEWQNEYLVAKTMFKQYPLLAKLSRKVPGSLNAKLLTSFKKADDGTIFLYPEIAIFDADVKKYKAALTTNGLIKKLGIALALTFSREGAPEIYYDKRHWLELYKSIFNPAYMQARNFSALDLSPAKCISRHTKLHVLFKPTSGDCINKFAAGTMLDGLVEDKLKEFYHHAIQRSIAVCIAIECVHAANKGHFDVKPGNLILVKDRMVVQPIDFGSAYSCGPEDTITITEPLCTYPFAPPDLAPPLPQTYHYDWSTDAWSVGICLQMLLFPTGLRLATVGSSSKYSSIHYADPNETNFRALREHYYNGIKKHYGQALASEINKLLNPDRKKRAKITDILQFFVTNHPEASKAVIAENISYILEQQDKITASNPFLKKWLADILAAKGITDLRKIEPESTALIFKLRIISRYLQLLHYYNVWTLPNVVASLNKDLNGLLEAPALDINLASAINDRLNKLDNIVVACLELIHTGVMSLYTACNGTLKKVDALNLLNLHVELQQLMYKNVAIPRILAYAHKTLCDIADTTSEKAHSTLILELAAEFQATLQQLGDGYKPESLPKPLTIVTDFTASFARRCDHWKQLPIRPRIGLLLR